MKPRHKRIAFIASGILCLGVATALVLNAFQSNLVFFYSPSQIAANEAPQAHTFRLGGMVEKGSLEHQPGGADYRFAVTDFKQTVHVRYSGVLPDLFREGAGVVAHGRLAADGDFVADEVLAKHDEKYMPPEVARSLKKGEPRTGTPE